MSNLEIGGINFNKGYRYTFEDFVEDVKEDIKSKNCLTFYDILLGASKGVFNNNSLFKSREDGRVYMVVDETLKDVQTGKAFIEDKDINKCWYSKFDIVKDKPVKEETEKTYNIIQIINMIEDKQIDVKNVLFQTKHNGHTFTFKCIDDSFKLVDEKSDDIVYLTDIFTDLQMFKLEFRVIEIKQEGDKSADKPKSQHPKINKEEIISHHIDTWDTMEPEEAYNLALNRVIQHLAEEYVKMDIDLDSCQGCVENLNSIFMELDIYNDIITYLGGDLSKMKNQLIKDYYEGKFE